MITKVSKQAVKYVVLFFTIVVIMLYVPALLSFWFSPNDFFLMGFLTLAFPYTTTILFLLCIFWFVAKPKVGFIVLLVLVFGFKNYKSIFAFNDEKEFVVEKPKNSLRIATWNIQSFNGLSKNKEAKKNIKTEIQNSILKYQPDIVCLQEFNTSNLNESTNNIALFNKNYPYYFFSEDYQRKKNQYKSGCIIFSTLPIIKTGKIKYPIAESLIYADVLKDKDTIRVYTTHLQSFKFNKEDYDEIENVSQTKELSSVASKNILKKMRMAFKYRAAQAKIVKSEINKCLLPSIICGDFNDVPASNTYFTIKENRQDAFLKTQLGIGRTFNSLAPTLRIDYILPDKHFSIKQFDMIDENLSDHFMLITDLIISNH